MRLLNNGWYKADEGKIFVLTAKGKEECASYKFKTIGKPVDEYEDESPSWAVEKGYAKEVDNPNWIVCTGYKVVYNHNGYELSPGNGTVFFSKELAEKYMSGYKRRHTWFTEEMYIVEDIYKGKKPIPCNEYNGKLVYNWDYFNIDVIRVGDYVEESVVDDIINSMPPACMKSSCMQCGEPSNHKMDKDGKYKPTYETFKKVADGVYEYCGECFRGKNIEVGEHIGESL